MEVTIFNCADCNHSVSRWKKRFWDCFNDKRNMREISKTERATTFVPIPEWCPMAKTLGPDTKEQPQVEEVEFVRWTAVKKDTGELHSGYENYHIALDWYHSLTSKAQSELALIKVTGTYQRPAKRAETLCHGRICPYPNDDFPLGKTGRLVYEWEETE